MTRRLRPPVLRAAASAQAASRPRSAVARLRLLLAAVAVPLGAMLVSPVGALAAINEDFKPQNEFKLDPWIPIHIGGLDLSITKGVFYVVLAAVATTGTMVWIARRMQAKPNRVQAAVEVSYSLMRDNIAHGNMGQDMARKWFPFVGTIFLFIWFSNMLGYLPLPTNTEHSVDILGAQIPTFALYAATANLSVPLVLTLVVVGIYHAEGLRVQGTVGYFRSWIPGGTPSGMRIPIFVIEVISHFVRIVSLSVRLFANMLAGHLLILFMGGGLVVLLNLAVVGSVVLGLLTGAIAVGFFLFEIVLIATLQAFIFATLTAIYFGGAVAETH